MTEAEMELVPIFGERYRQPAGSGFLRMLDGLSVVDQSPVLLVKNPDNFRLCEEIKASLR